MDRLGLVGLGGGKACDIVGRITVVILEKRRTGWSLAIGPNF